jgi:hypothetical protein
MTNHTGSVSIPKVVLTLLAGFSRDQVLKMLNQEGLIEESFIGTIPEGRHSSGIRCLGREITTP